MPGSLACRRHADFESTAAPYAPGAACAADSIAHSLPRASRPSSRPLCTRQPSAQATGKHDPGAAALAAAPRPRSPQLHPTRVSNPHMRLLGPSRSEASRRAERRIRARRLVTFRSLRGTWFLAGCAVLLRRRARRAGERSSGPWPAGQGKPAVGACLDVAVSASWFSAAFRKGGNGPRPAVHATAGLTSGPAVRQCCGPRALGRR